MYLQSDLIDSIYTFMNSSSAIRTKFDHSNVSSCVHITSHCEDYESCRKTLKHIRLSLFDSFLRRLGWIFRKSFELNDAHHSFLQNLFTHQSNNGIRDHFGINSFDIKKANNLECIVISYELLKYSLTHKDTS